MFSLNCGEVFLDCLRRKESHWGLACCCGEAKTMGIPLVVWIQPREAQPCRKKGVEVIQAEKGASYGKVVLRKSVDKNREAWLYVEDKGFKESESFITNLVGYLGEAPLLAFDVHNDKLWLNEGDRYTCSFHKMTNSRRRSNVVKIRIDMEWLTREDEIRQDVVKAYTNLLSNPGMWRANSKGLVFLA